MKVESGPVGSEWDPLSDSKVIPASDDSELNARRGRCPLESVERGRREGVSRATSVSAQR